MSKARSGRKRPRQRDALLFTAGEIGDGTVLKAREIHEVQDLVHALPHEISAPSPSCADQRPRFPRHPGEGTGRSPETPVQSPGDAVAWMTRSLPPHSTLPAFGRFQTRDDLQNGRLAAARRTQEAQCFLLAHRERYAVQQRLTLVALVYGSQLEH